MLQVLAPYSVFLASAVLFVMTVLYTLPIVAYYNARNQEQKALTLLLVGLGLNVVMAGISLAIFFHNQQLTWPYLGGCIAMFTHFSSSLVVSEVKALHALYPYITETSKIIPYKQTVLLNGSSYPCIVGASGNSLFLKWCFRTSRRQNRMEVQIPWKDTVVLEGSTDTELRLLLPASQFEVIIKGSLCPELREQRLQLPPRKHGLEYLFTNQDS